MNKPLISVVMSVYMEREEWLRAAIDSILNQTYTNIEFIIINDCPECAENIALLNEYAQKDSRIKLIFNEQNLGPARSRNKGFALACGEYIAIMDSDDISHADRLEKELCYMQESGCDIVSAYMNDIDEAGTITLRNKARIYSPRLLERSMRYNFSIAHAVILMKKQVADTLEGYRDIITPEDYDFVVRAINNGFSIGACSYVLYDRRIKQTSISRSRAVEQLLLAEYIRHHFDDIESCDIVAYAQKIHGTIPEKAERNYKRSLEYIRAAAASGTLKAILLILCAAFTSKYAWINVKRMIQIRIVRFRYRKG